MRYAPIGLGCGLIVAVKRPFALAVALNFSGLPSTSKTISTNPGMNPRPTMSIEYGAELIAESSPQLGLTDAILADGGLHGTLNGGTDPCISCPLMSCATVI